MPRAETADPWRCLGGATPRQRGLDARLPADRTTDCRQRFRHRLNDHFVRDIAVPSASWASRFCGPRCDLRHGMRHTNRAHGWFVDPAVSLTIPPSCMVTVRLA